MDRMTKRTIHNTGNRTNTRNYTHSRTNMGKIEEEEIKKHNKTHEHNIAHDLTFIRQHSKLTEIQENTHTLHYG